MDRRLPALADQGHDDKAGHFSLGDAHVLADIVAFDDEVGVRPSVEVLEPDTTGELGELLGDAGFSPIGTAMSRCSSTPTSYSSAPASG